MAAQFVSQHLMVIFSITFRHLLHHSEKSTPQHSPQEQPNQLLPLYHSVRPLHDQPAHPSLLLLLLPLILHRQLPLLVLAVLVQYS